MNATQPGSATWFAQHASDPEPVYVPPTYPKHRKIRLRKSEVPQ